MSAERVAKTPRAMVHRGHVLVAAFWVPASVPGGPEARVLALWEAGVEVRRLDDGYLVLLRQARRRNAELGGITPLVQSGKWLCSAPLRARELAALDDASDLALVDAGQVRTLRIERLERVDPALWLDVSAFSLCQVKPLRAPLPPQAALPPVADPRAALDASAGVTAADAERRAELVQALATAQGSSTSAGPRSGGGADRVMLAAYRAAQGLGALWQRLKDTFSGLSGAANRALPAQGGSEPPVRQLVKPPAPSLWERLRTSFAGWLLRTQFGEYLGRKHAQYLSELFEMLERRSDEEVLRHAIPLSKDRASEAGRPSLGQLAARSDFSIQLHRGGASSSLGLGGDLYEMLRRAYEAVFQRLDAAGKYEQAAYFLAEILDDAQRAVAYLEKHGRLQLAAELAEARGLPAGLVVRQWFLAGNHRRAVLIATRENAFDDAILRLRNAGQEAEAAALQMLQAERLASAGRLVRAASLVHALPQGLPLALRWLELARAAGELRGVALELSLDAGRFEVVRDALAPLLGQSEPDQLAVLVHLGESFVRYETEVARPLARELGRELLAVAAQEGSSAVGKTAARVADYVGGAFKADRPALVSFEQRVGGTARRYALSASDAGTRPICDVHRSGRHFLVALGEAGVVLYGRQGKRLAHFDIPADSLVTSFDGSRALCVMRRDERIEVGRIDLATRRSERWCDLAAASFAPHFDGETWFVCTSTWQGSSGELLQLDVLDERPSILQRAPMPLEAPRVVIDERFLNLVGAEPFSSLDRMRYELPQLTLRERSVLLRGEANELEVEGEPRVTPNVFIGAALARGDEGVVVYDRFTRDLELGQPARLKLPEREIWLPADDLDGTAALALAGPYYALRLQSERRTRVLLGARNAAIPYVDLELGGAARAAVTLYDDLLLIGDDAGRVLGIEPRSGAPLFDLRV